MLAFPAIAKEADIPRSSAQLARAHTATFPYTETPVKNISAQPERKGIIGNGQCIDYVKHRIGYYGSLKSPKYLWENAEALGFSRLEFPAVGAIMITDEGPVWHVAYIDSIDIAINVSEQNYQRLKYTERTFDTEDARIIGFLLFEK